MKNKKVIVKTQVQSLGGSLFKVRFDEGIKLGDRLCVDCDGYLTEADTRSDAEKVKDRLLNRNFIEGVGVAITNSDEDGNVLVRLNV